MTNSTPGKVLKRFKEHHLKKNLCCQDIIYVLHTIIFPEKCFTVNFSHERLQLLLSIHISSFKLYHVLF